MYECKRMERGREMECVLGFLKRGESGAGYLEEVKSVCEYCRQRLERRQAKAEQVASSSVKRKQVPFMTTVCLDTGRVDGLFRPTRCGLRFFYPQPNSGVCSAPRIAHA